MRELVLAGGGHWLPDAPFAIEGPRGRVLVHGSMAVPCRFGWCNVLCAHDPAVFPRAARAGFSVVLAGHLHGGQVHLWSAGDRSYPAAVLYQWNGLAFRLGRSSLFVSRGVADLLPIRWRCPREMLLCEV